LNRSTLINKMKKLGISRPSAESSEHLGASTSRARSLPQMQ
jgi:hypothetical protein